MKHKLFFSLFLITGFAFCLAFLGCNAEHKNEFVEVPSISDIDTLENDFAEAFQIIYHISYIEINIIDPNSKSIVDSYKISKTSKTNEGMFPKDINSAIAMSTTQLGMMRKLGLEQKVTGFSNFGLLCYPLNKNTVTEVGDIGTANPEAFVSVNPDVIFYSGFNDNSPILNKLKQANLKTFKILEWKESHPMGRAEWIKVYGALFQKEKEANAIYNEIKSKYYALTDKLKLENKGASVFAGTYFGDVFNVPAGESYMAILLKDANVDYVYSKTKGVGSLNLSLEKVITENKETEYWLNAGVSTRKDLLNQSQKFDMLRAVKTGKIYGYFGKNNCFWENSPMEPHLLLEDLGKIFHPELFEDKSLNYYELIKD